MADVKAYRPRSNSLSVGQVLPSPYDFDKTRLIVREMTDGLVLDMVDKGLAADQVVLTVGYDIENLSDPARRRAYQGPVKEDWYGRAVPRHAHGTANLGRHTSSASRIMDAMLALYDRIVDRELLARRIYVVANHVISEKDVPREDDGFEQLDLFEDDAERQRRRQEEAEALERERRRQETILSIKKKFGKNAILKGTSLEEGATARERNEQIGGHRA